MPSPDARVLTDAAERRRIVEELDRSLLVEAGAGSGKTHEMGERMAAGIASGAYNVEHMAAVTFTRKAAAELRGRFQLALENQLARSDGEAPDVAAAVRIRGALSNIERLFAGTIHSFCARLLRERPVEAGVAPGFVELDDAEDAMYREQSWRDYRSQAQAAGDADLLLLDESGIKPKQLDEAFKRICLYEEVDFPPGDAPAPDAESAWAELEAFWGEVARRMPSPVPPGHKCATLRRAVDFESRWRFSRRQRRTGALLAELLSTWESKPNVTGKWWALDDGSLARRMKAELQDLHGRFREETVLPYLTAWRQHVYAVCVRVLIKARTRAADDRRRRNALSFNDLLVQTARLLRTRADVRRALQQKYRWLFVDEFQDTDPIQAEIIFLLAGEDGATGDEDADWRTIPVRPGALFVVGDPKQSIFRFTRADIDIYNQVRDRLAGDDRRGVVTLTTNFRSVPDLCGWANTVFEGQFPKEADEYSPRFAPLDAAREEPSGVPDGAPGLQARGIFTLTIPPDADDGVGEEADRIARFIRAEVDAGRRSPGDFLVITRKKKNLQRYSDAIEALKVPVEVSGGSGFSESNEVRELALLLLALTDPQDQVALVGTLRGAFFGLSDQDLFAWRQDGGWFSLFSEPPEGGLSAGATRVAESLARLRQWHGWTRVLPAGAALERILEDSGSLALAATVPGGVDAGDLLHAIDRVRAFVETGFTLAEAAEALASWSLLDEEGPEESTEIESLPLEPGRPDVVRVMNLHKAKGLEAPVVFLADPTGGYPPRVNVRIIRAADSDAPPLGYFEINTGFGYSRKPIAQPEGWDGMHHEELQYLEAEGKRLLYVASTRAKDVLVVGRWAKQGKYAPAWSELDSHLVDASELAVPDEVPLPAQPEFDLAALAVDQAVREVENAHGRVDRPSWSATSVTAEAKRLPAMTLGADEEDRPDDPTRSLTEDTPSRRADAGVAWGTLIHGLLEHAMRHGNATRDDLRRLAMWLTIEEPQLRPVIEQALDTVEAVKDAEFWAEARASAEVHEEAPFAVRETGEGKPSVVTGTVDVVFRKGPGWKIVDYKTDVDVGKDRLQKRYEQQLATYAAAWSRTSGAETQAAIVQTRETGDE